MTDTVTRQISEKTGICFFKVLSATKLSGFLQSRDYSPLTLDVSGEVIREWLEYGCIYVDGERKRQDADLLPEQVVRLHTRRKNYPIEAAALRPLIVEANEEFLVLDKPAGLPTHPTLDNFLDNAKVKLERELGYPLYTTHRLDVPTQGLLVFAKTPDAQRLLNKNFSLGRVEKIYRSINGVAVPPGLYTHFIDPAGHVPRPITLEETAGWWRAQLEILANGEHQEGYWHEIKLLTGKTHQIRAQMTALGAPIVGDETYGGRPFEGPQKIALECFRLSFRFRTTSYAFEKPQSLRGY